MSTQKRRLDSHRNATEFAEPLRRTESGAIDYDHYIARGRTLRAQAITNLIRRAGRAVAKSFVFRPLVRRRARRSAYRELASLDDYMLKDIGLDRSDIRAIAAGTWEGKSPDSLSQSPRENTHGVSGTGRCAGPGRDGDQKAAA